MVTSNTHKHPYNPSYLIPMYWPDSDAKALPHTKVKIMATVIIFHSYKVLMIDMEKVHTKRERVAAASAQRPIFNSWRVSCYKCLLIHIICMFVYTINTWSGQWTRVYFGTFYIYQRTRKYIKSIHVIYLISLST